MKIAPVSGPIQSRVNFCLRSVAQWVFWEGRPIRSNIRYLAWDPGPARLEREKEVTERKHEAADTAALAGPSSSTKAVETEASHGGMN